VLIISLCSAALGVCPPSSLTTHLLLGEDCCCLSQQEPRQLPHRMHCACGAGDTNMQH
jgi:hypothetical protein